MLGIELKLRVHVKQIKIQGRHSTFGQSSRTIYLIFPIPVTTLESQQRQTRSKWRRYISDIRRKFALKRALASIWDFFKMG